MSFLFVYFVYLPDIRNFKALGFNNPNIISDLDSNIENVTVVYQDARVCVDSIILTARNRVHLARIMRRLKELSIVLKITRVKG